MIAAMIFISPSAIRPAISTATASATIAATNVATIASKAATTAIDALRDLYHRLKHACLRLFGLNATSGVSDSVSISVSTAARVDNDNVADYVGALDSPTTTTNALTNHNERQDEHELEHEDVDHALQLAIDQYSDDTDTGSSYSNDDAHDDDHVLDDEDEDEDANNSDDDDIVSIDSIPWLPQDAQITNPSQPPYPVIVAYNHSTMNNPPIGAKLNTFPMSDYSFFQWIPSQVLRRLATDELAITYFDMIHTDYKYAATLSADKKNAAILLLNILHLKLLRISFDLDYDYAIVDIVVRVLLHAKFFVEAYKKVVDEWLHHYLMHRLKVIFHKRGQFEYPESECATERTELTNAFPFHHID